MANSIKSPGLIFGRAYIRELVYIPGIEGLYSGDFVLGEIYDKFYSIS